MPRMLATPTSILEQMALVRRISVVRRLEAGMSEDEIYRRGIDVAIRAARLEGCDESDVEVAASQARRDIAEALAEARNDRRAERLD